MNLTKELTDFAQGMAKQAPQEALEIIGSEIQKLAQSGITERALKKGDRASSFSLQNAEGQQIALDTLLKEGPVIVSFNRGNWCPFCSLEFRAIQESLPNIAQAGASLVSISPQRAIGWPGSMGCRLCCQRLSAPSMSSSEWISPGTMETTALSCPWPPHT